MIVRVTATLVESALDWKAAFWRIGAMRVSDFDFDLPEDRIALRPAIPRDAARMLLWKGGQETFVVVSKE